MTSLQDFTEVLKAFAIERQKLMELPSNYEIGQMILSLLSGQQEQELMVYSDVPRSMGGDEIL